jgi:thiol-disulfide isomerase/thioredoxin
MSTSRWIPAAAALLAQLAPMAPAADLPRKAPDYTINLLGGKTLPLSQYKGHPIVLAFILTYCSHCQATVGVLSKLQNEYAPRGLQVLASAIETNAQAAVPGFLRNFSPPFPVGYNTGDSALAFMQHPVVKIPMMPLLAFIDKQGEIRVQYEGDDPFFNELMEQNLRKEIEALLKGPPAKKGVAR